MEARLFYSAFLRSSAILSLGMSLSFPIAGPGWRGQDLDWMVEAFPMARQVKQGGQVLTRQRAKVKEPGLWKVLLHNDDYTTQEFVVWLLKTVFRKAEPEATAIMLAVHKAGVGVAGVYTRDVAETRAERGRQLAEREGFPLLLTVEAEDA